MFSRVMSKDNHDQGSTREKIFGGRAGDRSVCVSLYFSGGGLFGLIVGVEGHTVICALRGALRLHSRG